MSDSVALGLEKQDHFIQIDCWVHRLDLEIRVYILDSLDVAEVSGSDADALGVAECVVRSVEVDV